jgi:hypothetical protein
MNGPSSGTGSYSGAPRRRLPGWAWGGACACLLIVGTFAIGLLSTPLLKRFREAQREFGRTSICLSNVKQAAAGLRMYAQDYDERLPEATSWMDAAAPYAQKSGAGEKAVLRCPTALAANPAAFGYAYSANLAGKQLSKIANTPLAPAVYDSSNLARNAADPVTSLPNPARHRARRIRPGGGHVNMMGYLDGHAGPINEKGKPLRVRGLDGATRTRGSGE